MLILGLNAYHGDSSACMLKNGEIIAAAEEERFHRIKHWAGFPSEAIHWCLKEANATLVDLDHIAINSDPKAQLLQKVNYSIKQRPDLKFIVDRVRNRKERSGVEHELASIFPNKPFSGKVHQVEHHLSHLASATGVLHLQNPYRFQ